ncbi:MAG: CDP-alcohol phosphatidyltransferase family protein [Robiginitomaculum sp.]|nr:CDP-alcohol phosphatidyltransferase family protein [Robiginitomaculum sp.]
MFDKHLRPWIDPPLNVLGRKLVQVGISANQVTLVGLMVGLAAGISIGFGYYWLGLLLILINRLFDGLDGAIARASHSTDFGGYLDIVCDFAFYVVIPIGFGFAAPGNLPFALVLVASFTVTGISFLAFALMAAKQGRETTAHGKKSFFYSTGIAEGTETIIVFVVMCLFPTFFTALAVLYTVMCVLTVIQRSVYAWKSF